MELALLIWFANISSGIAHLFGSIGTLMVTMVFAFLMIGILYRVVEGKRSPIFDYKKSIIGSLVGGFVCLSIAILIPDERTIYLMTAGYVGQQVVTSDKFNKSANDVYEIVDLKLKQIKTDMTDELEKKEERKNETK